MDYLDCFSSTFVYLKLFYRPECILLFICYRAKYAVDGIMKKISLDNQNSAKNALQVAYTLSIHVYIIVLYYISDCITYSTYI